MSDDFNNTVIGKDGLPRTRTVDEWNRLPDAEKAQILTQWSKTWSMGGSGAVPTSTRIATPPPAPPKAFNADDRSIGDDWHPSPEQLLGTKDNAWK
jgi:hypothetical protein